MRLSDRRARQFVSLASDLSRFIRKSRFRPRRLPRAGCLKKHEADRGIGEGLVAAHTPQRGGPGKVSKAIPEIEDGLHLTGLDSWDFLHLSCHAYDFRCELSHEYEGGVNVPSRLGRCKPGNFLVGGAQLRFLVRCEWEPGDVMHGAPLDYRSKRPRRPFLERR